jgi:hypothetical protein
MGDEGSGASDRPPLGAIGDEPSDLEAEEVVLPEDAVGLAPPTRAISELPQIHSALLPSRTTSTRSCRSASDSATF